MILFLFAHNLKTWQDMVDANGKQSFQELKRFLETCPHWPSESKIIAKAEKHIEGTASKEEVLAWFRKYPPQSFRARDIFVEHLSEDERTHEARRIWQTIPMTLLEQKMWKEKYHKYLNTKAYQRRLDMLCVQGLTKHVEAFIELVPEFEAQAKFRLRLLNRDPCLTLPKDAGRGTTLTYVQYLRAQGDFDGMAKILQTFHRDQNTFSKDWAYERLRVAKEFVQQKRYLEAYDILDKSLLRDCASLNDVLLFKVEIGYYFLNYGKKLVPDLERLYQQGAMPNTKSFAAYYLGVIKKDKEWLHKAAHYPTTFFGLKAIEVLGIKRPPFMNAEKFAKKNELIQTFLSLDGKDIELVNQFIFAIVQRDIHSFEEGAAFIEVVNKRFGPPLTLWAGFAIQKKFIRTPKLKCLYPRIASVKKIVNLALIRQESLFDSKAKSCANAYGYMQLIKPTAERFAQRKVRERDLFNPTHNLKWGDAYLQQLHKDYNGCLPLVFAAYNAGEHRVDKWIELYGDPGVKKCEIPEEQFIAMIPFKETKHYVMQILANKKIYEELV